MSRPVFFGFAAYAKCLRDRSSIQARKIPEQEFKAIAGENGLVCFHTPSFEQINKIHVLAERMGTLVQYSNRAPQMTFRPDDRLIVGEIYLPRRLFVGQMLTPEDIAGARFAFWLFKFGQPEDIPPETTKPRVQAAWLQDKLRQLAEKEKAWFSTRERQALEAYLKIVADTEAGNDGTDD